MDSVTDFDRLANTISKYQPDIVALQEIDSAAGRNNGLDYCMRLRTVH